MLKKVSVIGVFAILLLIPLASNSEAKLWDLQIQANVDNNPIYSGERPLVSGVVIDHASKPVSNASINVKSESLSIFTKTSKSGEFFVELGKHERLPGSYLVTILASADAGKTGISTIEYQVKGELSPESATHIKLSTPEAQKYLNSEPDDFERNPLGLMLYNYYQNLQKQYQQEKAASEKLTETQEYISQQKIEEEKLREKAIKEFNPGPGIFSGPAYDNYVANLDEEIRDIVVEHLDYTKNLYLEAQIIREQILENGGTMEEAQEAFLEKISTNRDMIENFGQIQDAPENSVEEEISETETQESEVLDKELETETAIQIDVDGENVEVDYKDEIFSVEVNGKLLEFAIQDGKIIKLQNE